MNEPLVQTTLDDFIVTRERPGSYQREVRSPLQDRYAEWRLTDNGRAIYAAVLRRALRLKRAGWSHYGIKAICETVRFLRDMQVGPDAEGYRLNNNYSAGMAREMMESYPELDGFFATRLRVGDRLGSRTVRG